MRPRAEGRFWPWLAACLGAVVWVYDSLLDALIFYEAPFWDMFILHVPARELTARLSVWAVLLGLGYLLARRSTTQRRREAALQQSIERLKLLLDGIEADIYVADMETYEILFLNRHMRESFGQDLVGQICYGVFRGETEPCGHCTNDQLLDENGRPKEVIVWEGLNPLTGRWYLNHDHAVEWADGRYVRLQLVVDITHIKEAESDLLERSANLEREVEARTRQLAEAQARLLRAEKLAALGKMASGIAHDLRNPLAVISNAAYMLATTLEDGGRIDPEYVRLIQREVQQSGQIIEGLLQFSRQSPPNRVPIRLGNSVRDTLERHPPPAGIQTEVAEGPWDAVVLFDASQLAQVLTNLVLNGYDAMRESPPPEGGHCLRFSTRHLAEEDRLELWVEDTGPGIPPADLERIFEPLYTTKQQGTGMGLAIAQGLAEANGGALRAQNGSEGGACFILTMPTASGEPTAIPAPRMGEQADFEDAGQGELEHRG